MIGLKQSLKQLLTVGDARQVEITPFEFRIRRQHQRLIRAPLDVQIDAVGVRDAAQEALSALKDAQKIRSSLTGATNSVDSARQALNAMVSRVEAALERVESLIATS